MNLGGIVLVVLTIILTLGFAAGVYALLAGDRARAKIHPVGPAVPEERFPGEELPPREDAWKPAVWYSEAAEGTLFPNQPSPSFRISADSSFQRAITRRELEDLAVDGPTEPQLALPGQTSAPADRTLPTSIPDEVEALSEIPTVMMKIAPVKDDLPTTVKMRATRRNRFTPPPPPPESETDTNGGTPTNGNIPAEIAEMEVISPPPPTATPAYEPIPDDDSPPEDSADTIILETGDNEDRRVDSLHAQEDQHTSPEDVSSDIFAAAETDMLEVTNAEPEPVPTADAVAKLDPGLTWMPVEESVAELVEKQPDPGLIWLPVVDLSPVEELGEEKVAEVEIEPVELPLAEQPVAVEADHGLESEIDQPVETGEQRYDRLLREAYSQAIHLRYDAELDAIEVRFTNCPVMESSDVPWVFQTIGGKIQELFASDAWQPHGLLLDVAGLQVAPEAEAAWEMVLDGFVTQLCPEVAPRIALAIQYDSSAWHDAGAEDETAPELQRASSVTGQPRPLVVARSFEAALLLLQLMRREI